MGLGTSSVTPRPAPRVGAVGIFKKRSSAGGASEVYLQLRSNALELGRRVDPVSAHPDVQGVVIDIPRGGATATIVALADGTTSMCTSTGGGVIGGGGHEAVARATTELLVAIQANLVLFPRDGDRSLPPDGFVRYTVLTPEGRRIAHVPEAAFWGQEASPVADLIAAAQAVLSRLREVTSDA